MRLADTPVLCLLAGRSPRWPKLRRLWLKTEPTCAACGRLEFAQVHHVVAVHLNRSLELAWSNLMTLCEGGGCNHHLEVGHLGDWQDINSSARELAAKMLAGE